MKKLRYVWLMVVIYVSVAGCSEDPYEEPTPPIFVSSTPADGAEDVNNTVEVSVTYDQVIKLSESPGIKINGEPVEATTQGAKILISENFEKGTKYVVRVPAGAVVGENGVSSKSEIEFSFTTEAAPEEISASPVIANASPEAVNVYDFLKEIYGSKILSGSMANVSWNTNEADWVYKHTGKYPAMTTFDFIHLHYSPDNWIDYSNIQIIEDWWANNGIVSAMWHWKVPKDEETTDKNEFTYRSEETSFSVANATIEGTWENEVVKADLEEMANYLKLLQEKNIPVVWRPLHEAAGNIYEYNDGTAWFWWGSDGAEAFKKLWIYMFEYFEQQGLNNLIWVWTTQRGDNPFYPGDEYVDIVGRDIYGNSAALDIADQFKAIQATYPNKMVALSEMGGVATISDQWNNDALWSFFTPWYDYERTLDMASAAFEETSHSFANIAWWQDAFANEAVISRDEMPNLK